MRILLTGASGLVGAAVARAAHRRGHHVVGLVHAFAGELTGLAERRAADLTLAPVVQREVLDLFPEAIVNCAAISEPAQCEADPARAQSLNVELPATLAQLAHHMSARFVHVSSEQVFAGDRSPYAITDPVAPINLYGRQKVASERRVHAAAPEFAVSVRAPLLLGNSPGGRRSLHERLFADWSAGRTPRLYLDEIRQPCTADNLAEVLVELCERPDVCGPVHWAGAQPYSRAELAEAVRNHFRLTREQAPFVALPRAEDPAAARRQASLALNLSPLAGRLRTAPQSLEEALGELVIPPPFRAWYLGGGSAAAS